MKRLYCLPAIVALLFCACSQPGTGILNPSNLSSSFITIDPLQENTLKTPKGAIIKIAANSFEVPAGTKVSIEIKEAYSMQDILRAGLVTESNGQPLQSGGMIFIGATAGKTELELLKPVKVSIPTPAYDSNMQLFKGEVRPDSSVNWIDPQPLDSGLTMTQLLQGEAMFKANCAACHKPKGDFTGPALAGCRSRGDGPDWAYRFTNNTNKMIEKDPYARYLLKRYGSRMTQFNLPYRDLKAIFDYCDNEYSLNYTYEPLSPETAPVVNDSFSAADFVNPCGTDTVYLPKSSNSNSITLLPDTILAPATNDFIVPDSIEPRPAEAYTNEGLRYGFSDLNPTVGMYDFTIQTLGWYNIDYNVKGYAGTQYVSVKAALEMPEDVNMNVYLFYPAKKMLSVGHQKEKNIYDFDKVNGKIPLYINSKVVLLAFGSKADRMYFGVKDFVVKKEQVLKIFVKETSEKSFMQFLEQNDIEGIDITIEKKEIFKVYNKSCITNSTGDSTTYE